ncbi:substrate-binding domain-containing protein [Lentzea sp. BCCO 10_0798]|uniref:Substrate-binding domain-containing protein n=1 Tax=Lentzea kristufekii TaxID=3095430 RepID=A0ABU4TW17_9PSEU|nr:substrate-binding domain-containing protein [Lentzea sp. BCCO 10_0798]MDX8052507.1 substrate-binding domain-containing protein [Lentzea sp. BCCO 10_0798]
MDFAIMRRRVMASSACLLFLLSACGDAGQGSPTLPTRGPKPIVGVILPDRTTSTRWEEQDRPLLTQAFNYADIEPFMENAEGDEAKFAQIADEMIRRKVKVLMITPLSAAGGLAVQKKAKAANIPVIDYDRVTLGGQAEYHVGFDSVNVGQLQADGLLACLGDKPGAQIIEIEGAPTDHNATLFTQGQKSRLSSKYDSGALKLVKSQPVADWNNDLGGQLFEQILNENGGKVDGVVAANDGLAGAVIAVLKKKNLRVPVTGQDATVDGLRAVLGGDQCVTVYKPVRDEAEAAARLAIAIARGDLEGADDLATGNLRDPVARRDIKSVLLGATLIKKDTVRTLVTEGIVKPAELCAGALAQACAQQDILGG